MPWAPRQRCAVRGCLNRQSGSRCAEHRASQASRNHHGVSRHKRGLGYAYAVAKRLVLERDGYACQIRGRGCTRIASQADHLIPRSQGGLSTVDNMRAACGHCNAARGARSISYPQGGSFPLASGSIGTDTSATFSRGQFPNPKAGAG